MWGRKWRERRDAARTAATAERLVARARELAQEIDSLKRRKGARADIQDDLFAYFREAVPLIEKAPILALTLIDLAPLSIQAAVAKKDWDTTARAGIVLSTALLVLRKNNTDGLNVPLQRELGRFLGAHVDVFLFALAQLPETCHVGMWGEVVLEGGLFGRQLMQTADPEVRSAWDRATGVFLNGGAGLTDDEIRDMFERGAWTSERQRGDLDPEGMISSMLTWMSDLTDQMKAAAPSVAALFQDGNADAAWAAMLNAVDAALKVEPAFRLPFANVAMCVTPLAASASGRDIVYLIAGVGEAAAVRYHGEGDWRRAPEALRLPGMGIEEIRGIAQDLDKLSQLPAGDLEGRTALMNLALEAVGHAVAEPVLSRWPTMTKVTFIPVGEMQELPLSTALVGGRRLNDLIDVTIAPNAAAIVVVASGQPMPQPHEAVVMADPANRDVHLPWVVVEAEQVAAVYGKRPDLLVEYSDVDDLVPVDIVPVDERSLLADLLTDLPVLNATSEHVLTQIEEASVVHLACHGLLPENDELPALLLHGALTFDALEHHRFADGATVVLSACSVGRSIREVSLAALGFPAMLLSTGAGAVIASSRPLLDCKETVELMVLLHQHLRAGETAGRALALAMQDAEQRGIPSAVWGSLEVHGAQAARG
jgi:hypothetical protein